jgi:hypothetical protein
VPRLRGCCNIECYESGIDLMGTLTWDPPSRVSRFLTLIIVGAGTKPSANSAPPWPRQNV